MKDIAPVGMLHKGPFVLGVHPSVQTTNVKDFIELVRARPRALNYASSGVGGASHLATEFFRQVAKIDIVHVPCKGEGPAMAASPRTPLPKSSSA